MAGKGGKRSTSFKTGQSGNPGGRPKALVHVQALAREYTEEAILKLVAIMRGGKSIPAQAQAGAAGQILDRGWGKPAQTQGINVNKHDVRQYTRAELDAALAEELALEREAQEKARDRKH